LRAVSGGRPGVDRNLPKRQRAGAGLSHHASVAIASGVCSEDLKADRDRLLAAGASVAEDYFTNPAGDQLLMLRDPWGLGLQLVKRAKPMLG